MQSTQNQSEQDRIQTLIRTRLHTSLVAIENFCERWHIVEFALFGSFLRDDFTEFSDVDVLVQFEPNNVPGLKFVSMALELEELFGRPVDVLTRPGVEQSQNYLRRRSILNSAEVIYAAR